MSARIETPDACVSKSLTRAGLGSPAYHMCSFKTRQQAETTYHKVEQELVGEARSCLRDIIRD